MLWFFVAILATLLRTGKYVVNKKVLEDVDSLTLSAAASLFTFILYSPVFLFSVSMNPIAINNWMVYLGILASGFLNSLAIYLVMKSLKLGELSVSIPLRNLVPLFALVWGVLILGEPLSLILIPAVLLIVVGASLLHMKEGMNLSFDRKPSMFALGAALLYSFAIIADKYVTNYMRPRNYVFFIYGIMVAFLFLFSKLDNRLGDVTSFIKDSWKVVIVIGILGGAGSLLTFTAISMTLVSKVAPVLRAEVLFSALAGVLFFKERNILLKIIGASLLMVGLALVVA